MNKCKFNLLVIAFLLLMPCLALALPGAHDPTSGGYSVTCQSCHEATKSYGNSEANYTSNVCLTCHLSGTNQTLKVFKPEDFADIAGTSTMVRGTPIQSSHKWFGSDVVPKAGAQAPVDPAGTGLNKNTYFSGSLFCARCHNIHGTSGAQSNYVPYLRAANDSDQLCTNCHRSRDKSNHTFGTHPVNVAYSTAYKANPTKFIASPDSGNPISQLKLVNGKVVCSSCHKVHASDSRTATLDNYSTGHAFSNLSASKGYLLRVDAYGKTGTDINICTNCHAAKKNHNMASKDSKAPVQCNDCHSGHVEYDSAATGGETTPNIYLVRRYLQYTTAGRVNKRILYNSTTTKNYYSLAGKGVCQSCHNLTNSHFVSNVEANGLLPARTNCSGCHKHDDTSSAFKASGCNGCHGYPPVDNTVGGPTGKAAGYTGSELTSPHVSHAGGTTNYSFACNQCHNGSDGAGATHDTGTFNDGEFVTKVPVTPGGVIAGPSAGYNGTQCSNIYCHSDGTSTTALGSPKTVTWAGGLNTINDCSSCHASVPATGAHAFHITTLASKGYGCVTCHSTTVSNNTTVIVSGGKHVNAVKDISFSDSGLGAGLSTKVSGTSCSAVYCHSNGKGTYFSSPSWTGSAACGSCHATATVPGGFTTTSHATHFTQLSDVNNSSCATCHVGYTGADANHVNGIVNVDSPAACAGCHADPYSSSTPAPPTWGSAATGCNACHSAHPINANGPVTGSHGISGGGHNVVCVTCHAAGTTATTAPSLANGHGDGNIDVANVGYLTLNKVKGTAGTTCSAASCHVSPTSTTLIVTPAWGSTGNGCAACHKNSDLILTNGPATGSHGISGGGHNVACVSCHAAGTTATVAPSTGHADGNIDVANVGYLTLNKVKGTAGTTCSAASCHVSPTSTTLIVTPAWGSTGNGCAACHKNGDLILTNGPATGSHGISGGGHNVACVSCHAAGTTATVAPSTGHADGNIDVANVGYLTLNKVKGTAGTSCTTTTCHGSSSPNWGANTSNVACTKCHGKPTLTNYSTANAWQAAPGYAQVAGSGTYTNNVSDTAPYGAHDAHVRAINQYTTRKTLCSDCHGTLPVSSTHANGLTMSFSDLAKNIGTSGGNATTGPATRGTLTPTYAGGTCSAVYCHGGVMAGTDTTPEWRFTGTSYLTPYAKDVTNCGKCHAALPVVAAKNHSAMNFATQNCNGCHGHEGNGSKHIDGILQASSACNSCHGYQVGSWAGAPSINAEGKGAHEAHITWLTTKRFPTITLNPLTDGYASAATTWTNVCGVCHGNTAVNHTTDGTGTVNVELSSAFSFGGAPAYKGTPGTPSVTLNKEKTCSNISCHYFTTPLWSTY